MISTLRSIDSLLNRFDELSQCHASILSDFNTKFSDMENPLRNVMRTEEQRKSSVVNILLTVQEENNQVGSTGPLEDFHRRVLKNRHLHRPPHYASNDTTSNSSFATAEIVSLSRILVTTNQTKPLAIKEHFIESKVNVSKNEESKISPERHAHGTIRAFTMETINRLAQPKRYNPLPEERSSSKPSKPTVYVKKDSSTLPKIPPSTTKRTKATIDKSSSKKLKIENKIPVQTSKRDHARTVSRPPVPIEPARIVRPKFSSKPPPLQKSFRPVPLPKTTNTIERSMIKSKICDISFSRKV